MLRQKSALNFYGDDFIKFIYAALCVEYGLGTASLWEVKVSSMLRFALKARRDTKQRMRR